MGAPRQAKQGKEIRVHVHGHGRIIRSDTEAFAATAFVLDIRVVETEAFIEPFAHEVEFGAVDVRQALRVDHDVDAVAFEHQIALVALVAIQLFVSHIAKQESGGHYSPVGLVGFTTVNTGPAGGEVNLDDVRELERRPAISDATIAAQTRIRVVEEDGYRVKVVAVVEDSAAS